MGCMEAALDPINDTRRYSSNPPFNRIHHNSSHLAPLSSARFCKNWIWFAFRAMPFDTIRQNSTQFITFGAGVVDGIHAAFHRSAHEFQSELDHASVVR